MQMMRPEPLVCGIVINWNRWEDTAACIQSMKSMNYPNLKIILVDNASTQTCDPEIAQFFTEIEIIWNTENIGFASGVNLGIKRALQLEADFIFTLNNDSLVDPGCLMAMVNFAEEEPSAAILGPKIYYMDPPDRIWFAGANRDRLTLALLNFGRGKKDCAKFDFTRKVTYLCAGAMLIRKEVIESVGGFDPGYFMYYEDCEFCMHASSNGYNLYYVPEARVWHSVAVSTGGEGSVLESYYRTCSVFRFIYRNSRGFHRLLLLTFRTIFIILQILLHLLLGKHEFVLIQWKGLIEGLACIREGYALTSYRCNRSIG
jgi:GT2 family glycosyltransferase